MQQLLPDCHSLEFLEPIVVEEMHEVSEPATIPSPQNPPHSWSSDPGITSSRSGNHHSNGDSRSIPEYEWNGWERVPRDKIPSKHFARQTNPATPQASEEETTSPLATDMDIDNDDQATPGPDQPAFPDGYIPLEIPRVLGSPSSSRPDESSEAEGRSSQPSAHALQPVPDGTQATGLTDRGRDILPEFINPQIVTQRTITPNATPAITADLMAANPRPASVPPESIAETGQMDNLQEDDAFEDAPPQLPEPSSARAP